MKYLISLIFVTTALIACHDDNNNPDEPKLADRTVLVYMAAENNLDSYAVDDLSEILLGSKTLNKNQNLIVYVDRATNKDPFYVRAVDGEFVDTLYVTESLTADPAVLESALRYSRDKYPAKSYGLVLWGHASGWLVNADSIAYANSRAYGGDTGNNSTGSAGKYWMNIPPMARAISNAMGSDKLTFVLADCCNFGCVEIAYEMKDITDYLIASPAEIPDAGAPYDLILADLFNQTGDFYRYIIDDYYDYYIDFYKENPRYYNRTVGDLAGYSVPLVAVKTSELDNLAHATASVLNTIPSTVSKEGQLDLDAVLYYGVYTYRYCYDMYSVLKKNAAAEDVNWWKQSFDNAIAYQRFSQKWMSNFSRLYNDMETFDSAPENNGCLSMFFPNTMYNATSPNWNTAINQFKWNNIIRWEQYGW